MYKTVVLYLSMPIAMLTLILVLALAYVVKQFIRPIFLDKGWSVLDQNLY